MIAHFKEGNSDLILPSCFFPLYKITGCGYREHYCLIIQLRIQPTYLLSSPQWTCSFRIISSSSQSSSEDISCLHEKHFHPLSAPGRKWKENAYASQQDVELCTWVLPLVSDLTCSHNPGTNLSNMPYVQASREIRTSLKEAGQGGKPQRH